MFEIRIETASSIKHRICKLEPACTVHRAKIAQVVSVPEPWAKLLKEKQKKETQILIGKIEEACAFLG